MQNTRTGHNGREYVLDPHDGEAFRGPDVPASVKRFIRRFDRYEPVKPFSFELDVTTGGD